jgi:hypothetical protein
VSPSRKKKFLIWGAILGLLVILQTWYYIEPGATRYKGKSARQWNAVICRHILNVSKEESDNLSDHDEVGRFIALRSEWQLLAGKMIANNPSWFSKRYAILYASFPNFVQNILPPKLDSNTEKALGWFYYSRLGIPNQKQADTAFMNFRKASFQQQVEILSYFEGSDELILPSLAPTLTFVQKCAESPNAEVKLTAEKAATKLAALERAPK